MCLLRSSVSFCAVPTGTGTDRSPSRRVVSIKLRVVPRRPEVDEGRHALARSPGAHLLEKVSGSRSGCASSYRVHPSRVPIRIAAHVYSIRSCTHPIKGKQRSPSSARLSVTQ